MRYYFFIDESGDHGLSNIDPGFPIFTLCGIMISEQDYDRFRAAFNDLKLKYWNSIDTVFHSRDIRKCEGPFRILFDQEVKEQFYKDFNRVVRDSDYKILTSSIDKVAYMKKYGLLSNDVYEISLSFLIERAVYLLDDLAKGEKELQIVLERRGKKEDKQLEEHFQRLMSRGTYHLNKNRLARYSACISFKHKKENINGLQLADLVAYPIARFILDPQKANPAFKVLQSKIYGKGDKMHGLKKHP